METLANRNTGKEVGENIFSPHKATQRRLRRLEKIKAYLDTETSPANVAVFTGTISSWLKVSPRTVRDDLLSLRGDLAIVFWWRNGTEYLWTRRALDRRTARPGDGSLDAFTTNTDADTFPTTGREEL